MDFINSLAISQLAEKVEELNGRISDLEVKPKMEQRSVIALVAHGGNELYVPVLFFESMESGHAWCAEVFPETLERTGDHRAAGRRRKTRKAIRAKEVKEEFTVRQGNVYSVTRQWLSDNHQHLFVGSYYDGCGWPGTFELKSFAMATPVLSWDLD